MASSTDQIGKLINRGRESYVAWAPTNWRPTPTDLENLEQRLASVSCKVHLLNRGSRLVGVAFWEPARARLGSGALIPGRAHLGALYVDPASWSQGVASQLHQACLKEMRELSYDTAQLWTPIDNLRARRFYEHHRWRHEANAVGHQTDGLDLALYLKDLNSHI